MPSLRYDEIFFNHNWVGWLAVVHSPGPDHSYVHLKMLLQISNAVVKIGVFVCGSVMPKGTTNYMEAEM